MNSTSCSLFFLLNSSTPFWFNRFSQNKNICSRITVGNVVVSGKTNVEKICAIRGKLQWIYGSMKFNRDLILEMHICTRKWFTQIHTRKSIHMDALTVSDTHSFALIIIFFFCFSSQLPSISFRSILFIFFSYSHSFVRSFVIQATVSWCQRIKYDLCWLKSCSSSSISNLSEHFCCCCQQLLMCRVVYVELNL